MKNEFKVGDKYRYRGFYNFEDRDEIITITSIEGKYIHMSNGYATIRENDGSCLYLTKLEENE